MTETLTSEQLHLLVSLENGIKTLTFNVPQKKNPITPPLLELLKKALEESRHDGTRVIVLTGAGKDFSAGADLSAESGDIRNYDVTKYLREQINPAIMMLREIDIPVIAKVRGVAVGVGFSFALACDMLYASTTANFSAIFVRIGLSTDGGCSWFLARSVGHQKAFELMSTGAMISAAEGAKLGFVNHVVADDELDAEVQAMAEKLAGGPWIAIKQNKVNLRAAGNSSLAETLETEALSQGRCFKTQDFMEGIAAFAGKRKPNYKGE